MGLEPLPVKVRIQWCSGGEAKVHVVTKGAEETSEAFVDRVVDEALVKLNRFVPSNDCEPPFP